MQWGHPLWPYDPSPPRISPRRCCSRTGASARGSRRSRWLCRRCWLPPSRGRPTGIWPLAPGVTPPAGSSRRHRRCRGHGYREDPGWGAPDSGGAAAGRRADRRRGPRERVCPRRADGPGRWVGWQPPGQPPAREHRRRDRRGPRGRHVLPLLAGRCPDVCQRRDQRPPATKRGSVRCQSGARTNVDH